MTKPTTWRASLEETILLLMVLVNQRVKNGLIVRKR